MNTPVLPPEEERFATNVDIMARAVHESVTDLFNAGYQTVKPDLIILARTLMAALDKHYLIRGFIENSHKTCWDSIKRRNEKFFIENAGDIFKYLPVDEVNIFRELFTTVDAYGSSVVSQDIKDELWDLFDVMVKIAIKYVHKYRNPYSVIVDGEVVNHYATPLYEEIDIYRHANTWGLKLDFPLRK
jgi:hypothetical protein